jgi:hypothetical protein
MATIPNGTTVTFTGLPKDHGVRCNSDHGVIQAASVNQTGGLVYYIKSHAGAQAIFSVPATNVLVHPSPNPPLPLPGVQSGYQIPSTHTAAP